MMKKSIIVLVLVLFTLIITGCSKKEETTELHIGLMKSLVSVPFYYAQDEKIFEKYGLDVKLELYNSAKDRDASFQGGQINAVSTDMIATLLYLNSGKKVVITSITEEEFRLVKNKEYDVNSISDINGGKIGVSENTVIEYLVDTAMEKNEISNYKKVPVPSVPDRFNQLKSGNIDMAIMPEPFPSLIIGEEGEELWSNIDQGIYATVFVVSEDFANKNPEIINKLNLAINEAIQEMMSGSYEDYHDIIVNHGLLQEKDIAIVKEQQFNPLSLPDETTFNDVVNWTLKKGLISKTYKLEDIVFKSDSQE